MVNSGPFTGLPADEAYTAIVASLDGARRRPRHDPLPPARLADLAPALLGLPDPDHLVPGLRARAGARRPAAGRAARDRRLPAEGAVAARHRHRLGQRRRARAAAAPPSARRTRWTRSCARPGTTSATSTRTTGTPRGSARMSTAGCPSTSTSAASSTRSCTCSTRASSRRSSTTPASSASRSRSSASSRRA